jgi:hypothetical protein
MKHYSRENDRNRARVAELERLKGSYEASVVVMGACWTQVRFPQPKPVCDPNRDLMNLRLVQIVETIRDLLQPVDQAALVPVTEGSSVAVFCPRAPA